MSHAAFGQFHMCDHRFALSEQNKITILLNSVSSYVYDRISLYCTIRYLHKIGTVTPEWGIMSPIIRRRIKYDNITVVERETFSPECTGRRYTKKDIEDTSWNQS